MPAVRHPTLTCHPGMISMHSPRQQSLVSYPLEVPDLTAQQVLRRMQALFMQGPGGRRSPVQQLQGRWYWQQQGRRQGPSARTALEASAAGRLPSTRCTAPDTA